MNMKWLFICLPFFSFIFGYAQTHIHDGIELNTSAPDKTESQSVFGSGPEIQNHNPFALVAGGSKGIGFAISEALAKRKYNLILIARHKNALEKAKTYFEKTYKIQVEILVKDLADESSATEIADWCMEKKIPLKMLCNVAGLGGRNDFLQLPLDSLRYMVNLNLESEMALVLQLLPLLKKNAPSYILNVASMAAFAPIPSKNMYSASKSASLFFSYNLRYQLKPQGISVSVLCPGPVFTKPEIEEQTIKQLGRFGKKMAVSPYKVGEIAVKKTLKKRMIIVPGTLAKTVSGVLRIVPRRWAAAIYAKLEK